MSQFIDRRLNSKNRSAINRQRFIRRFKKQIKEAVSAAIDKRRIRDIENGEQVIIPHKDIDEPRISHGQGGQRETVLPGNKEYLKGDKIPHPSRSQGSGGDSQASPDGEGMDDFSFYLSKEEFLNIFFDDLALPNLVKRKLTELPNIQSARAGLSKNGSISNLNILRTFRQALSRRLVFKHSYDKTIETLKKQEKQLHGDTPATEKKRKKIQEELALLEHKQKKIPFIDEIDLRFNMRQKMPKPTSQAVMFCIMDVSGSMDEQKKELAKRFFILLYLFLTRNYKKIQIVFIRHHTTAKEVDEQDFFYSRETGGTVVSSALELSYKIIMEHYPTTDWNIYIAQASDGDNWNADSPLCGELLNQKIMPLVQYYAYIEIMPRHHQSLWNIYQHIQETFSHFSMRAINTAADIYPVFHELFKRKES